MAEAKANSGGGGLKPNAAQAGAMNSMNSQNQQMGWLLPLIMQAITPRQGAQMPMQQPMGQTAVPMPQMPMMPQMPQVAMPQMPGAAPMSPMGYPPQMGQPPAQPEKPPAAEGKVSGDGGSGDQKGGILETLLQIISMVGGK